MPCKKKRRGRKRKPTSLNDLTELTVDLTEMTIVTSSGLAILKALEK